jgi:hypothetical protein
VPRGATGVWFGGGEPTLHPGLRAAIIRARALGYREVLIQTNALRFADPAYCDRILAAGANRFAVTLFGWDSESYRAMTRHDQSWALSRAGIKNLIARGARLRGDLLLTTLCLPHLLAMVEGLADLGLSELTFWLLSTHGLDEARLGALVPAMAVLVPALEAALDRAAARGLSASSWHTPPCVLDAPYRDRYRPCSRLELLVVPPGAPPFRAETSPMEGGAYLEGCARCAARAGCLGPRADYLRLHGPEAFRPLG